MRSIILAILALLELCNAAPIFIIQQPGAPYAHPGVLINAAMEASLSSELKNDFYKDPRIVAGLAKESWLTAKEMQVKFWINMKTRNYVLKF